MPNKKNDSQLVRVRGWWEVAKKWEVGYLIAMPVIAILVYFQKALGVPLLARGFLIILVMYCMGTFFLFIVMLDRRAEDDRRRRGGAKWRNKMDAKNERQGALAERKRASLRLDAAVQRGREKAAAAKQP